ncbi:MAG: gliding motility protein GldL [Bacteroidales bacterium]|jgi:gliding motility-associated protein GldL|nr:gliding motility protein GldL [Bacteroidales bacterium]
MINITEIVQSTGWKKFMGKLYGWGAAVVLLGALFKIQHWTGATYMLTAGMLTEVLIFFLSAFEPIHEELDWTIVYPELAGIKENEDYLTMPERPSKSEGQASAGNNISNLNNAIGGADISPEVFEELGKGLKDLNTTTKNLSKVSDAVEATNKYVDNLDAASEAVSSLSDGYNNSNIELQNSVGNLSNSYKTNTEEINQVSSSFIEQLAQNGSQIDNSCKDFEGKIKQNLEDISNGNNNYNDKLESVNRNLSALNSVYELQLQNTNNHLKSSEELYSNLQEIMSNLKGSVNGTEKFKQEMQQLNENLSELNSVYGNMLSALNVVSNNN